MCCSIWPSTQNHIHKALFLNVSVSLHSCCPIPQGVRPHCQSCWSVLKIDNVLFLITHNAIWSWFWILKQLQIIWILSWMRRINYLMLHIYGLKVFVLAMLVRHLAMFMCEVHCISICCFISDLLWFYILIIMLSSLW